MYGYQWFIDYSICFSVRCEKWYGSGANQKVDQVLSFQLQITFSDLHQTFILWINIDNQNPVPVDQNLTSWWLNQPIWKNMLVKLGSSSPIFEVKIKNKIEKHHPSLSNVSTPTDRKPTLLCTVSRLVIAGAANQTPKVGQSANVPLRNISKHAISIGSMWGIYIYIYLLTFTIKINKKCRKIYRSYHGWYVYFFLNEIERLIKSMPFWNASGPVFSKSSRCCLKLDDADSEPNKSSKSIETPRISGWWLNQPIWKICSSNWKSSPIFGVNKNIWNHQLAKHFHWFPYAKVIG